MLIQKELEKYFDRLWPICRSITGNGLRESFKILQEIIPLQLTEVATGKKCFDWEIPSEWNIEDAYILTPSGEKIADFKKNNLHVLNYSEPINKRVTFNELKQHLFTIQDMPEAIPYVTSYYKKNWGFCLAYHEFKKLPQEGEYTVVINSSLKQGSLTYGDLILKGNTDEEVLFSTYLCHPSMANNELSGPLCMAYLYKLIAEIPNRKYTYRFVMAPETIGIIAYLAKHGMYMKNKTVAGYVLTCCGDASSFTYKMSKQENSLADKVARHVLKYQDIPYKIIPFAVGGSDERQYCSPGFNMPVGSLTRSMYQQYKEYHTSLDNKEFISFSAMEKTIQTYFNFVKTLELNDIYTNTILYCEPQLGKRGLYSLTGGTWGDGVEHTRTLLHFLSFADGKNNLIDIAEKKGICALSFKSIIHICKEKGLI